MQPFPSAAAMIWRERELTPTLQPCCASIRDHLLAHRPTGCEDGLAGSHGEVVASCTWSSPSPRSTKPDPAAGALGQPSQRSAAS